MAGTNEPIWAMRTMSAVCRNQLLLPAMFGSGENGDAAVAVVEQCVVRNELTGWQQCLERRVPASRDVDGQRVVDDRAAKAARGGDVGERRDDVEVGDRGGRLTQRLDMAATSATTRRSRSASSWARTS